MIIRKRFRIFQTVNFYNTHQTTHHLYPGHHRRRRRRRHHRRRRRAGAAGAAAAAAGACRACGASSSVLVIGLARADNAKQHNAANNKIDLILNLKQNEAIFEIIFTVKTLTLVRCTLGRPRGGLRSRCVSAGGAGRRAERKRYSGGDFTALSFI
ncbi:hypothetical protein EVAR_57340_1 [Eumeta japonica]|uniref:Uncharacterized protein n=1 Tax=Eumeta variegata TaxID=151549 RepID=A0A4C1Z220_EUMVA|nr:hypothetical protein EVAR_57340_1 [Eumeta japonica]